MIWRQRSETGRFEAQSTANKLLIAIRFCSIRALFHAVPLGPVILFSCVTIRLVHYAVGELGELRAVGDVFR